MAWWTKLLSLVYGRGVFIIDICRCSMNLNGVYFYFLLVLHPISLVGVLRLESKVSFLRGLIKNWASCQWIELETISDFVSFLYLLLFFRVVMDCDWDFNFSIIELSSIVFQKGWFFKACISATSNSSESCKVLALVLDTYSLYFII